MKKYFLILAIFAIVPLQLLASEKRGTIDDKNKYAWGSKIGWVNFGPTNGDVKVTDSKITGYAWSENYGWINLDPSNGGVENDDEGDLSGHAWNDRLGWLDFSDVEIDEDGDFSGTITIEDGSRYGQIIFSCGNCSVETDWRPKSVREEEDEDDEESSDLVSLFTRFFTGGEEEDDEEKGDALPKQLFDINLEIDDAKISSIKRLVARVIFTSFGTEPTPVKMTFSIVDESGNRVYYSKGEDNEIVVKTEAVFNKTFEGVADLASGKYTLVLNTLYNTDVEDEFRADFEIVTPTKNILNYILKHWVYWVPASLVVVVIMVFELVKVVRRR